MAYGQYIRQLAREPNDPAELALEDARQLFAAMLDGGVPELELGAILSALRMKSESRDELLGFYQATNERLNRLSAPETSPCRPVVVPSYGGTARQPNLSPLVALLLHRMGVPTLVHGALEVNGGVNSIQVFRDLGVLPSATLAQAQSAIDAGHIVFAPIGLFSPGLANLLAARGRLGFHNTAHTLAKLVDPFGGAGLRMIGATSEGYYARLREFLLATGERAMLMRGTDGEPYANPRRRPRIEYLDGGNAQLLFEQEQTPDTPPSSSETLDAKATAVYIRRILDGRAAVPLPIVNQLAACVYCSGFAKDFNQAKAIVAVQAHSLAA
jgi:anthranilate phosphoribosyltransferase